mmetsp:Transcript_17634/g.40826  ORF Transcript_17634/g.40826 Transcript_17634/m.40826 type:complete len:318 (-) Transcript_17634:1051-2004(-)
MDGSASSFSIELGPLELQKCFAIWATLHAITCALPGWATLPVGIPLHWRALHLAFALSTSPAIAEATLHLALSTTPIVEPLSSTTEVKALSTPLIKTLSASTPLIEPLSASTPALVPALSTVKALIEAFSTIKALVKAFPFVKAFTFAPAIIFSASPTITLSRCPYGWTCIFASTPFRAFSSTALHFTHLTFHGHEHRHHLHLAAAFAPLIPTCITSSASAFLIILWTGCLTLDPLPVKGVVLEVGNDILARLLIFEGDKGEASERSIRLVVHQPQALHRAKALEERLEILLSCVCRQSTYKDLVQRQPLGVVQDFA